MLKSLFPQVNWTSVKAVGFDLDGTLYDELDFITQVYWPIAERLASACGLQASPVFESIVNRWIEKGSSYNRIFDEVLADNRVHVEKKDSIVAECLNIYRTFQPSLSVSSRVRALLDFFKSRYCLFLITDGREKLQHAKIESLELKTWFSPDKISVSGEIGADVQKPSTQMLQSLNILDRHRPHEIVYFGDRPRDKKMAERASIQFVAVHNMYPSYLIDR